jgi:hypothetical protein
MITPKRAKLLAFAVAAFVGASWAGQLTISWSKTFHHDVIWALGAMAAIAWVISATFAIDASGIVQKDGRLKLPTASNWANFFAAILTGIMTQMQLFYQS